MIRAYDDYGNVVDLVEWEAEIRADERHKFAKWLSENRMVINCVKGYLRSDEILEKYENNMKGGADLSQKCGSCKWLNKEKKTSVGYVCENTNKKWRTSTAHLKPKTCKACKEYEKKDYIEKGGKDTNVTTCIDCILDGTDACDRGAGRAVDDEICESFMKGDTDERLS